MGPVTYKIQRHPHADHEVVHMDKLMPYYPDFGEQLHSWIETDCPIQYRDQETQTSKPVLQGQVLATVDTPPPMHDPAPVLEAAEPHTDTLSTAEEPVETDESFIASPLQPEVSPAVLETPLESTSGPDQELSVELAKSPEVETCPMLCPAGVSNRPQPIPTDSDGPVAEPEAEPTDECVDPYPELSETSAGSRSLVPLPCRGTRSCKQPERDTPIRRLQVLPVTHAQD